MSVRRRVRIDLAYDGTDYHGWQVQPRDRTVQGTLESALARMMGGHRVPVRGAGRTDAGVHALGQVADAVVPASLPDADLLRGLASILPDDIRVHAVRTVDDGFHPWRHALGKTYAYRIDRSAHGDPFLARFALHRSGPLDRAAVDDALARLPGRRDWSGFADSRCEKDDRVREVVRATYREAAGRGVFVFRADGFLTRMVRNFVGTLLEIGRGRMPASRIDEILRSGDRTLAGPTAPAKGLHLVRVTYPSEVGDVADAARVGASEEDPWTGSW